MLWFEEELSVGARNVSVGEGGEEGAVGGGADGGLCFYAFVGGGEAVSCDGSGGSGVVGAGDDDSFACVGYLRGCCY